MEQKLFVVDNTISSLLTSRDSLNLALSSLEKELKRNESNLAKTLREVKEIQDSLKTLEKTFNFILNERDFFGIPEGEYDFKNLDIEEAEKRFFRIKQEQQNLQKRVNLKVEAMSDKVERKYIDLMEKRKILAEDKIILNLNMDELDKKKQEALEKCYLTVSEHFGKIFSTLLPFTYAKIQQIPGKDLSDGLEIGVSFNGVWKKSFSELSGGQRSLLALSFILSLLRYKPAPFYILDEIDAVLDLSYTENIGKLITCCLTLN